MGITAKLLKENNIIIYNENEIEKLLWPWSIDYGHFSFYKNILKN
jgi:hypothetical protein